MLTYHRTPYPESITPGTQSDYLVRRSGRLVARVRHVPAGRSYGRFAHWSAYDLEGNRLCYDSTFRALKAALAKVLDT